MADMDGLERLRYAWGKARPEARGAFYLEILREQGLTGEGTINMTSQVGSQDGRPYVVFEWEGKQWRLTPAEAQRHAMNILEVATGAEADAFLVNYLVTHVGTTTPQAAQVLQDFRQYREALERQWATEASEGR